MWYNTFFHHINVVEKCVDIVVEFIKNCKKSKNCGEKWWFCVRVYKKSKKCVENVLKTFLDKKSKYSNICD